MNFKIWKDGISRYHRDQFNPVCVKCGESFYIEEMWEIPEENIYEVNCPLCNGQNIMLVEDTRVFTTGYPLSESQKKDREIIRKCFDKAKNNDGEI